MVHTGTTVLLLLAAACSAGNPPGAPRDLLVARTASSVRGRGPEQPQVVLAPSATALSRAIEANVPDSGDGTYLAAYWGEKPTGGYSLGVESAHVEGAAAGRVRDPGPHPPLRPGGGAGPGSPRQAVLFRRSDRPGARLADPARGRLEISGAPGASQQPRWL